MSKKEDMKEALKKEETKDRAIKHAFELFSKGSDNATIKEEMAVFYPEISETEIQEIRKKWEEKKAADEEMIGGAGGAGGGEEKDAVQVGETPSSEQKIEPLVTPEVEPVIEKKVEEKVEDDDATYVHTEEKTPIDDFIPADKKLEGEPDYKKAADGLEEERRELERMKAEVRDDKAHVEIVRATEELRRAITSEIHAQESYEDAKREMESAKEEMVRVRSELDKFKESVDMLKLRERLLKREPVEDAKLETETVGGRRFEERISNIGLERTVEDIVDKVIRKREVEGKPPPEEPKPVEPGKEKPEGKIIPEPLEARNGRVDDLVKELYKKNLLSIEDLAVYLDISIEEARKLELEREQEMVQPAEGKKPAGEITAPSKDDALAKVAEMSGTSVDDVRKWIAERHKQPKIEEVEVVDEKLPEKKVEERTTSQKFYDKVKRYLDIHPYLVVKKELGVPEVYYIRLKRNGILIGLEGGIPAGCLLLYIILLLAGVL